MNAPRQGFENHDLSMHIDPSVLTELEALSTYPSAEPVEENRKKEEKIALTSKYGEHIADKYLNDLRGSSLLSHEEEITLSYLAQKGDLSSRNQMIECNLRLVIKVARNYLSRGLDFLDLVSEGNMGLIHAVEKFDYSKGYRFSTYAIWWIRESIEKAIMNQGRSVRLPIYLIKDIRRCLSAQAELNKRLNRKATYDEIAEYLGISASQVSNLLKQNEHALSIDMSVGEENDYVLGDVLEDSSSEDPSVKIEKEGLYTYLEDLLTHLSDFEREIVARRYGLDRFEEVQTLDEVAKVMALSRSKVRSVQMNALAKLQKMAVAR